MKTIAGISVESLRDVLHYNPETGIFTWKQTGKGKRAGGIAGNTRPDGYRRINVGGKLYYAHRLAYLYMTGEWPKDLIDHANMDPSDNRWCNIRACDQRQNRGNRRIDPRSRSGIKGIHYRADCDKWWAYICPNGRLKSLGMYKTLEEAMAARATAAKEFFGDFAREGKC